MLARFLQFLRINPGLDVPKLLGDRVDRPVLERIWPDIDLTAFRSAEKEFVAQVVSLALMSLAALVVESVLHPERTEEYRKELMLRMEIIRRGSVTA